MTSYDVVRALLRRWWILLAGVAATFALVGLYLPGPAIYWATYDLNLVAPDRAGESYSRADAPSGVIPVAGVLEILLAGNHSKAGAATQQVPIFGLDDRPGYTVQAKDKGLQWSRDYVAALTVQIAEPSRDQVLSRVADLAGRAHAALETVQDEQGVSQRTRLTLEEPSAIEIVEIAPSRIRATAAGLGLGLGLSIVLTVALDRLLARRTRRRSLQTG